MQTNTAAASGVLLFIQFLPFVYETHKCYLVFCDPNVGEFQHTIIGETLLPEPNNFL